ncbi:MAG TPA: serine/threonine-protein kinase [Kofleriaceae bacterium]|nr:serine/threonine-protein kinase [Kofleriaceae bacterium]
MGSFHDDPTVTVADKESPPPRTTGLAPSAMLGRYVVLSELARGGMSVVYVAYDPELDRRVALKVVRGSKLSELHRARLHREAQALARLSHPSVVTVFDVGDIEDDTFVAMELVDGVTLREWLKQTPRTWREVVRVILAAGRGLAAAHAAGIVHRDVKPDNIVIAANGTVKLVDFGIARDLGDRSGDSAELDQAAIAEVEASTRESTRDSMRARRESRDSLRDALRDSMRDSMDDLHLAANSSGGMAARPLEQITQMGFIVGTPAYMPPEQRSDKPEADERSDQFSLCATLYEGLYARKPFASSKKLDRSQAVTVNDKPGSDSRTLAGPPPRDTDVPAWLQRVVSRGLAVDPNNRYPSVEALLGDLDRDPARTMRRAGMIAGAFIGVAAVATVVTVRLMPSPNLAGPSCGTGEDRVAGIWNAKRRAELVQIGSTRGGPIAAAALGLFEAKVDDFAANWQSQYHEACEATRVRATQSADALDLRMECLERRLTDMGALLDVLGEADADALRKAGEVAESLPKLAECTDVTALKQVVRRPTDPAAAATLARIDGDLARLQALYTIGDTTKTLALADRVIADARATNYAPSLAHALYLRGRAIADREGGPEAEAMFDQTFAASLAAGEDTQAADAAARIAQEALWAARLDDFNRWQRISRSLAERTHATNVTRFIDQLGCMSNHYYGKVRTRLKCLRDLAARKDGTPTEWLVTTLGIAATEAGEPAEAIKWLEKGVELAREENGADHPRTLEMRTYLCRGLTELGDYDRAIAECSDALAKLQKIAPDDTALIARIQFYLADAHSRAKHRDVAGPLLEAAEKGGDDEIKLEAHTMISELAGEKGNMSTAIADHRAAIVELEKMFTQYNPHHPNIISERYELGVALLAHGDVTAAADELAKADNETEIAEANPLSLAQLRFARAQAVARTKKPDVALARQLAQSALDLYNRNAPDTQRFRDERTAIEAWLANNAGK